MEIPRMSNEAGPSQVVLPCIHQQMVPTHGKDNTWIMLWWSAGLYGFVETRLPPKTNVRV
uniref:Uncharacterized protein n=2 Tax=Oryza sativa subsp. japonica TaxID=39947 RepID=Q8LLZ9_ORYSJ|nr:Hypothetical protein [Oryza sativa Japonica Group]AAP52318.1 hypothetical protein LOC_Os10g08720 [Oryza sativa Japonica Group]